MAANPKVFEQRIDIPAQNDDFDSIRAEYANMLRSQLARGNNGLQKQKYLTFGIEADSYKAAKTRLERIELDLLNNFRKLGVKAEPLDGKARLALMHGPTFMGNPLACAVALKGIEIFERDDYMSKIRHIEQISRQEMENFSDPRIKEVRIMGGCTCVEVHDPKTLEGFQQFAYERGVFCRPFLNYMYSMVPYVISDEELIQIFDVMKDWFH